MPLSKVLALARDQTALRNQIDRIALHCGTIGSSLAKAALENNGRAYVEKKNLLTATDTSEGEAAIFDNFFLMDEKSKESLFHALLKESIKRS